jgi:hypothetical protein
MRSSILPRSSRRRTAFAGAVLAIFAAHASPARAGACGDNVDGDRVPCRCGDNVVSDTVLWATDPVTAEPCSGTALTILVPKGADGITLNLGGQSLLGNGRGVGIDVAKGGRLGSVIVGGDADDTRAQITHFTTGIRATGRNVLREVRGLDVRANTADGLKIRASGVVIADVKSEDNGRDGVSVSGHGVEVTDVTSRGNQRDGLQVRGTGAKINAETTSNNGNGTVVGGRGNTMETIRSSGNGGAGVVATGGDQKLQRMEGSLNGKGDVAGKPGALK